MIVLIVFVLAVLLAWALEHLFKRDCGRPGCEGWEWTHTGLCSKCYQPVQGTCLAGRVFRRIIGTR
jgi:hypothetical protein